MEIVVERIELIIDGRIIDDGFVLPAFVNIPIIDVGKSWTLEQLIAISIIIGKETTDLFLLSFCMDSMALIPRGVAAPLIPRRFADIFIDIYSLLSSEMFFFPNILLTTGESNFEILADNPLFSNMPKIPSQIA